MGRQEMSPDRTTWTSRLHGADRDNLNVRGALLHGIGRRSREGSRTLGHHHAEADVIGAAVRLVAQAAR